MSSETKQEKPKALFPFECYIHNFTTDDPEEWYKHVADVPHVVSGVTLCPDCGHSTNYSENPVKNGYDKKGHPNFVPETKCKKCQDSSDEETIKRLKAEKKI